MLSFLLGIHCLFSPPSDWQIADPKMLSKRSIVGFIGENTVGFCPSLHLTHEKIDIPLKSYLSIVEKNCRVKKQEWKHLGKLKTQSGEAELIQIETKTKFGVMQILQTILAKDSEVFILTAGFPKAKASYFFTLLQNSLCSMTLCEDPLELIVEPELKKEFFEAWQKKQRGLESSSFEKKVLSYKKLGPVWQILMLKK